MRFSKRIGITKAVKEIQLNCIDEELMNSLWNLLTIYYWDHYTSHYSSHHVNDSNLEFLIKAIWLSHFKKPIDEIPLYFSECLQNLKSYFFQAPWNEVYDFIEFIAQNGPDDAKANFIKSCNQFLEQENSGYRFVESKITPITSETEIQSIENAINGSIRFQGVQMHLQSSLKLLSDRKNPDYRNSIKESISAVESLAKHISGNKKATLGEVIKELEKTGQIHPALKSAFSSLYGYTSDSKGIRHALLAEESHSKADALFMLVCCSAFINYVIDQSK